MATDHRGQPLHAGKRTDDEQHEQMKQTTSADESYKLTDPYMINEDGTKTYVSQIRR